MHSCCARAGLIKKKFATNAQSGMRSWHAVVVVVVVVVVTAGLFVAMGGDGEVFSATCHC